MKAFFARNLVSTGFTPGLPWEFQPTENLTAQIRGDREERQRWYRTASTEHSFYSFAEPANPNLRPSKENPIKFLHAAVADFDLKLSDERVNEAIAAMKFRPSFVERSLGGNARLVWIFPFPVLLESTDFASFFLNRAVKWLSLGLLPGLDEPAFLDPNRLYANGGNWRKTGHEPLKESALQSFLVKCGREYRFTPTESTNIPLDVVEKALRERFPNFVWSAEFVPDTQGPSFFVPESTTPNSAILKAEGFFTFSAHAAKPFYTWADLLGSDFVKDFSSESIANATKDIYWDGKRFWRRINGLYCSLDNPELQNYFKVQCRLSSKPGKDGLSLIDAVLDHIYNSNRIAGAAPHLFKPPGIIEFNGKRMLNTYRQNFVPPAEELTPWGAEGKFPFLSQHFENLFDPSAQCWPFLAWWKFFYESAVNQSPMPGQNVFLMGGVNVGKTMTGRAIVAKSVGGFADASSYLISGGGFNSEFFDFPIWSVDDETVSESNQTQTKFSAMLKKTAANQQFHHNKKFEVGSMTEWMGRIFVTLNLDYVSSRTLGPMDDSSREKTNVFRCAALGKMAFPSRYKLQSLINEELPFLLRWLLAWDPAEKGIKTDTRYGYEVFHESSLIEQATQSSKAAPFKELLYESLFEYFRLNPERPDWRGTLTQVVRLLHSNPQNEAVCRSLRLETSQRYLEMLQREGCIKCSTENGPINTRIWIFSKF